MRERERVNVVVPGMLERGRNDAQRALPFRSPVSLLDIPWGYTRTFLTFLTFLDIPDIPVSR